jgi:hypothetical protein
MRALHPARAVPLLGGGDGALSPNPPSMAGRLRDSAGGLRRGSKVRQRMEKVGRPQALANRSSSVSPWCAESAPYGRRSRRVRLGAPVVVDLAVVREECTLLADKDPASA